MRAPLPILDVTRAVSVADAPSVHDASERILRDAFGTGRIDRGLLEAGFAFVDRLFAGTHPGYLACDMPYHDLRHSLDTALVMARLVAGCRRAGVGPGGAVTPELALVGVLLALLHDVGYLRKETEAALAGPQLMAEHEARSVDFAEAWLRTTDLAAEAPLASLIHATRLDADCDDVVAPHDVAAGALGRMLGCADLVCQVADPLYLERCYYHLYPEFVLAGHDRRVLADGREEVVYRDAFDLLAQTGDFCERVVLARLAAEFAPVAHGLGSYFGGADPYAAAMAANLERVARVAADAGLLGDEPPTTTPDLAAVYHAPRPGDRATAGE